MKQFNDYEKGFLECFIDTDGTITVSKTQGKYVVPIVSFSNNSLKLLNKIRNILGIKQNFYKKN